jgi:hypothetical protein
MVFMDAGLVGRPRRRLRAWPTISIEALRGRGLAGGVHRAGRRRDRLAGQID